METESPQGMVENHGTQNIRQAPAGRRHLGVPVPRGSKRGDSGKRRSCDVPPPGGGSIGVYPRFPPRAYALSTGLRPRLVRQWAHSCKEV